jgi:uncharacterized protein (TIGR02145 family)
MKNLTRSFLVITLISSTLLITGCKKKEIPTLTTTPATELTMVSAKSGGNITDDGNTGITQRGVCWSTVQDPTTADNSTSDGTGAGTFESMITGLAEGTTYFVRAYATNSEGTAYGNQETFSTTSAGQATLTTSEVTDISFFTAKAGGNITDDGGGAVTARGLCWNTAQAPTISNHFTTDGAGTGAFTSNLTGLEQGTTYYVRAYATNKAGTAYGNQVTFKTAQSKAPVLTTVNLTGVTVNSVVSGGNITDAGGVEVTARGVCWGTSPNPTTTDSKTNNGTGAGAFVSNITGLAPGTVYYLRSYATNSAGTSYGSEIKFSTSIADSEGNVYKTVPVGTQVWMAENLKSTRLNDNTPIPNVPDSLSWIVLTTPGYSWYRNNADRNGKYGAIYNWFTVATGALCPQGWHVPTQLEFRTLEQTLGVPADSTVVWGWRGKGVGTHMKSTAGWDSLGNGDNQSGLNILPGGYRAWANGQYRGIGFITYLWTSTDDAINHKPTVAWYRRLDATDSRVYNATTEKTGGKSIRCMKNP